MSGEVAFGCQISEHCTCHPKGRQHAAIVAAGRGSSGRITVDLVWYGHPSGAVARLAELSARHDPLAVVVDAGSQSGTLLRPLADAGVWVTSPPPREIAVAHGEVLDLVQAEGLEHLDQGPLTAAVRAGQQRPLAGAQAWDRRNVQTDQAPLEAMTLAVHAFLAWEVLSQPGVWNALLRDAPTRLSACLRTYPPNPRRRSRSVHAKPGRSPCACPQPSWACPCSACWPAAG